MIAMASIIKRGDKFRVQVSIYKHGQHKKVTKTFSNKKDAELWALTTELEKGQGKQLAERETSFAEFFENWIYTIKKMM